MSEIGKRGIARLCNFLRGSHAAERLFLRGAFAALGAFFAYVFVAGHWSALLVIGLCALGYKANVEPHPHVGHGVLSDPRPLPAPPRVRRGVPELGEWTLSSPYVTDDKEPRIRRMIADASGTPISATPIVLGDAWANAATHPWSEDRTTDTAVRP
jgi:hypothetical protein